MVQHAFAHPSDGRADCSGRAEPPPAHFEHRIFTRIWIKLYGIFSWFGSDFSIFLIFLREKSIKKAAAAKKGFWPPKWAEKFENSFCPGPHFETKFYQKTGKIATQKFAKKTTLPKIDFLLRFGVFGKENIEFQGILGCFWVSRGIVFWCFFGLPFLLELWCIFSEKTDKSKNTTSGFRIVKYVLS